MFPRCLLLAALLPFSALAADDADDGTCRNGLFPSSQVDFALEKVTGSARLYLLDDMDGCPAKGEPACRRGTYVVTGDTLVTGRTQGGFRCAFYPNQVGGSAGWVDTRRLQAVKVDPRPALQAWVGTWRNGDDTLELRVRDGQLQVTGEAFWPSARTDRPGGPHFGQIDAVARPAGNQVQFADADDDSCTLQARLLGDYLIAADNGACGGMNVRFNGVYRRAR